MSRFFRGTDESSSSSEAEESDDELHNDDPPAQLGPGAARFAVGVSDSDDEEEEKRVVRSAKDKRFSELQQTTTSVYNALKINDWVGIHAAFEQLQKQVHKARSVMKKEGIPRFLLRVLVKLEDLVLGKPNKVDVKKLSKQNAKSFNVVKQKIRKYNKDYEKELDDFRSSTASGGADEDEEEDEDEDEVGRGSVGKLDDSESDDEFDDEDSDDEDARGGEEKGGINRWLKKAGNDKSKEADKEKKRKRRQEKVREGKAVGEKEKLEETSAAKEKEEKWTRAKVSAQLTIYLSQRGKKHFDRTAQVANLLQLLSTATEIPAEEETPKKSSEDDTPFTETRNVVDNSDESSASLSNDVKKNLQIAHIMSHLISARFDVLASVSLSVWQHHQFQYQFPGPPKDNTTDAENRAQVKAQWTGVLQGVNELLDQIQILKKGGVQPVEDREDRDVTDIGGSSGTTFVIPGSLIALCERLDDEYKRLLQQTDHHRQAYIDWLDEEANYFALCTRLETHYSQIGDIPAAARATLLRIAHLYDKKAATSGAILQRTGPNEPKDLSCLITRLCRIVYRDGDERLRTKAALFEIFHVAAMDRFKDARELLLMTHLQDTIQNADIMTQVLFNRTMAMVGLAALRAGEIRDAHSCLQDICASGRVKELLAQGVGARNFRSSSADEHRTAEQERLERMRLMPYHQHISLDLLEAAHLTSAMLLEVPNLAKERAMCGVLIDDQHLSWSQLMWRSKTKYVSRPFRRLMDYFDRQVFLGPPETTRELVVAASRAMLDGDNAMCSKYILEDLTAWENQSDAETTQKLRDLLQGKIREAALRTWLITNAGVIRSTQLSHLCERFSLTNEEIHRIVSRMVIEDELNASWDPSTGSIKRGDMALVVHKSTPTRLQALSLQLAERLSTFAESNDRMHDQQQAHHGHGGGRDSSGGYSHGRGSGRRYPRQGGNYNRSYSSRAGGSGRRYTRR